ncbi:hypothetical protein T440DRAFT_465610, partial [Plenodomus tracheiphilus IPT5]
MPPFSREPADLLKCTGLSHIVVEAHNTPPARPSCGLTLHRSRPRHKSKKSETSRLHFEKRSDRIGSYPMQIESHLAVVTLVMSVIMIEEKRKN